MSDILDLIDNAISDHYTSADAMRWTPEPTEADVITTYGQVFADAGPRPEFALRVVYDPAMLGLTADALGDLLRATARSMPAISLFGREGTA